MVIRMLFRPSYCANCGDKIERADWGIFTSRRFCPVCETEYKGTDLLPRVVVGISLLAGAAGLTGYFKGVPATNELVARQPQKLAASPSPVAAITPEAANLVREPVANVPPKPVPTGVSLLPVTPAVSKGEQLYYCGAATKKGTPCSRKVKGNVRCYQHEGMPAMLPPDKLKAS